MNNVSLGGAGPTWTDGITVACDSTHVVSISKSATSNTGAGRLITWTSGIPSVTSFDLPSPVVSSYGHATALYCDGTTIVVSGTAYPSAGRWTWASTIASPGSWTSKEETTGVGGFTGAIGNDPGDQAYTSGYYFSSGGTGTLKIYNTSMTGTYDSETGTLSTTMTSSPMRCSGAKVASNLYGFGCWADGGNYRVAYDGTTNTNRFNYIDCDASGSSSWTARQAWADNSIWFFLGDDGTNTHACAIQWNGTDTAYRAASQDISSKVFRGGAKVGSEYLMWRSNGDAWTGAVGNTYSSWFSDRSSSSFDCPPDSGTVTQVVEGIDSDGDGDATDNFVCFFSSGNIAQYGQAVSSGSSSSKQAYPFRALPFRALPFRFPEMP